MTRWRSAIAAGLLVVAAAGAAFAVQPDEVLSDTALERRARTISAELRCMVCQNQSIDDSDADLAKDLRVLVRDRLKAGDTDRQVLDYVVARYGEFVLLKPRLSAHTILLWGAPVAMLLLGALAAITTLRNRRVRSASPLTDQERQDLRAMLDGPG